MSLPATKAFERLGVLSRSDLARAMALFFFLPVFEGMQGLARIGDGFDACRARGSQNNDLFGKGSGQLVGL